MFTVKVTGRRENELLLQFNTSNKILTFKDLINKLYSATSERDSAIWNSAVFHFRAKVSGKKANMTNCCSAYWEDIDLNARSQFFDATRLIEELLDTKGFLGRILILQLRLFQATAEISNYQKLNCLIFQNNSLLLNFSETDVKDYQFNTKSDHEVLHSVSSGAQFQQEVITIRTPNMKETSVLSKLHSELLNTAGKAEIVEKIKTVDLTSSLLVEISLQQCSLFFGISDKSYENRKESYWNLFIPEENEFFIHFTRFVALKIDSSLNNQLEIGPGAIKSVARTVIKNIVPVLSHKPRTEAEFFELLKISRIAE